MKTFFILIGLAALASAFGVGLYRFLVEFSPNVVDAFGFFAVYALVSGFLTNFFVFSKVAGGKLFFGSELTVRWVINSVIQSFLLSLIVVGFLILEQVNHLTLISGLAVVLGVLILEAIHEKTNQRAEN